MKKSVLEFVSAVKLPGTMSTSPDTLGTKSLPSAVAEWPEGIGQNEIYALAQNGAAHRLLKVSSNDSTGDADHSVFSYGRSLARENPGLTFIFAGAWPDEQNRFAITTAVGTEPERISLSRHEELFKVFAHSLGADRISTNSFTDVNGGVSFVSVTTDAPQFYTP